MGFVWGTAAGVQQAFGKLSLGPPLATGHAVGVLRKCGKAINLVVVRETI